MTVYTTKPPVNTSQRIFQLSRGEMDQERPKDCRSSSDVVGATSPSCRLPAAPSPPFCQLMAARRMFSSSQDFTLRFFGTASGGGSSKSDSEESSSLRDGRGS